VRVLTQRITGCHSVKRKRRFGSDGVGPLGGSG